MVVGEFRDLVALLATLKERLDGASAQCGRTFSTRIITPASFQGFDSAPMRLAGDSHAKLARNGRPSA
jgi:hypothetical protein